ncbi:MAG TPA: response regulator [Actinomycetota bacterium]|jgi:two-component system sensor histidine kinase/response regulator|nr:response regulator [Actinomycetota bacterium]
MSVGADGSKPTSSSQGPGTRQASPGGARSGRILLAEDNAANRKLGLAMLDKLGYTADSAANGLEAVEAVGRTRYDAILMDCRMPEMDGFRATAEIRKSEPSSSRTPIIAMTADAMEGDRQKCLDAGMDDYLPKPVSFQALAAVLERWVPLANSALKPDPPTPSSSAPRVAEQEPPLDAAIIAGWRQLERVRGPEWLPDLISVFLRETESNLERLRLGVEQKDVETIVGRAHSLAGSVATFGAAAMGRLCRLMKMLGSEGRLDAAPETLAALEAEFERVKAAMRAEFPSAFPGSRETAND